MRRDAGEAHVFSILLEHLPDDLLTQTFAANSIGTIHGPEDVTIRDAGRSGPRIDRKLHPGRHRRGADASVLSNEIHNAPAAITLLDVPEGERRDLRSPEPTP